MWKLDCTCMPQRTFFRKNKKIKKLKVFHAKRFFQVAFWDNIFAKITVGKKL